MRYDVGTLLRNPDRVLHHLPLLGEKRAVIAALGLDAVTSELRGLRSAEGVPAFVTMLAGGVGLDVAEVRARLRVLYHTGLLEFHITDVCDLSCIDCHYRNKAKATFPFEGIVERIRLLSPRAITITGGGEPNLYRDHGRTLHDVVCAIKAVDPKIQLGLINNNTHVPNGDWLQHIDWQRSSVDAATPGCYRQIKGWDKYVACVENVRTLLRSPVPNVGVGFLYRTENIEELPDFLAVWYDEYCALPAEIAEKLNVQFRPISPAIQDAAGCDWGDMERRMGRAVEAALARAADDDGFGAFLAEQTNFTSIAGRTSYFNHTACPFDHCQNALLHRVLRADGDEYPDFLLCNFPDRRLGNMSENPGEDERLLIGLRTVFYHLRMDEFCDAANCRQAWVSARIERFWRDGERVENLSLPPSLFF